MWIVHLAIFKSFWPHCAKTWAALSMQWRCEKKAIIYQIDIWVHAVLWSLLLSVLLYFHTSRLFEMNCSNPSFFVFLYKKVRMYFGILLPKLFWPTVRKNCSSDQEKLLKFEAEGREFAKILRSLEQFIQTVKGQNNFW